MAASIQRLSAEQFKKNLAQAGAPDAAALVIKDFTPDISKDVDGPQSRICQFVISTGAVDRDGDTIDPAGWNLTNFQKSGAVLWGHDASQPPIAESLACWVEGGALKARCRFPSKDVYPFADTIYQLIKENVLRCTSVGFKPTAWTENLERAGAFMPMDFTAQELLEYSIVSVPANPEALVEAKGRGVDVGPYLAWAEKTLDTLQASGLLVPRTALEKTYIAAKGVSVSVPQGLNMDKIEAAPVTKGGRVLSAKNEERLQKAMDCYKEGHAHIKAIMDEHAASMSPQDPDGDGDDDTKPEGDSEPDSPSNPKAADVVSAKEIAQAIEGKTHDSISVSELQGVLTDLIDGALRRARGQ